MAKRKVSELMNISQPRRLADPAKPPLKNKATLYVMFMLPIFFVACLAMLVGGVWMVEYLSSSNWEPAPAVITQSSVNSHYESGRGSCYCYKYWVDVVYQYQVANGARYSGTQFKLSDRLCLGSQCTGDAPEDKPGYGRDQTWARNVANQYGVGRGLQVYYNPSFPEVAVVEVDMPAFGAILLGGGLAAFTVSALILWGSIARIKR